MDRYERAMFARVAANGALIRFGYVTDLSDGYAGLIKLLGLKSFDGIGSHISENTLRLCEALAGPHGYAIHKMLLLRLDEHAVT
jgi:hypothetical protein